MVWIKTGRAAKRSQRLTGKQLPNHASVDQLPPTKFPQSGPVVICHMDFEKRALSSPSGLLTLLTSCHSGRPGPDASSPLHMPDMLRPGAA